MGQSEISNALNNLKIKETINNNLKSNISLISNKEKDIDLREQNNNIFCAELRYLYSKNNLNKLKFNCFSNNLNSISNIDSNNSESINKLNSSKLNVNTKLLNSYNNIKDKHNSKLNYLSIKYENELLGNCNKYKKNLAKPILSKNIYNMQFSNSINNNNKVFDTLKTSSTDNAKTDLAFYFKCSDFEIKKLINNLNSKSTKILNNKLGNKINCKSTNTEDDNLQIYKDVKEYINKKFYAKNINNNNNNSKFSTKKQITSNVLNCNLDVNIYDKINNKTNTINKTKLSKYYLKDNRFDFIFNNF